MIFVVFIALFGALMFAAMAGSLLEEGELIGPVLIIPAIVIGLVALMLMSEEVNERWEGWSVCEDGETQIDSVIIADCDSYYKYPGEPDE